MPNSSDDPQREFNLGELENWNVDRAVNPPTMVRGFMLKTSANSWVYAKGDSTGSLVISGSAGGPQSTFGPKPSIDTATQVHATIYGKDSASSNINEIVTDASGNLLVLLRDVFGQSPQMAAAMGDISNTSIGMVIREVGVGVGETLNSNDRGPLLFQSILDKARLVGDNYPLYTQNAFNYTNLTLSGVTTILSSSGIFHTAVVNTKGTGSTLKLYDSTGIANLFATVDTTNPNVSMIYDLKLSAGLTVSATGTADITLTYRT